MVMVNTGDKKHKARLERQRRYREKNRDKLREKSKIYDNSPRGIERRKKWEMENQDHLSSYHKKWYDENKEEVLVRVKENTRKNIEKRREYMREYRQRPGAKELKKEQGKRYRDQNKFKIKVRNIAYEAYRDGKLTKSPCEVCGKQKVEMHHPDYSRPLEVRWLCKRHHMIADGIAPLD